MAVNPIKMTQTPVAHLQMMGNGLITGCRSIQNFKLSYYGSYVLNTNGTAN